MDVQADLDLCCLHRKSKLSRDKAHIIIQVSPKHRLPGGFSVSFYAPNFMKNLGADHIAFGLFVDLYACLDSVLN